MGVRLWIRKCHMLVQFPSYMSIEMFWVGTIDHEICTWSMYQVICIILMNAGNIYGWGFAWNFVQKYFYWGVERKKKVEWICNLIIRGRYDLIGRAVWITNKVSAGKKLESVKSHDGSRWSRRLWTVGCCCCRVTNYYHYVMQPTSP
jgi:hypothetical protein